MAQLDPSPSPQQHARNLLRSARVGTLATVSDGQPFASLVTPACAPDLSVLMWLSDLSEHTRHLRSEPRCSLMVAADPVAANPQTAPRVTVTGIAEPSADAALKARWLALHPYAALYAEFSDFSLWQVHPLGALYVGGFGSAARLRPAALLPDAAAVATISAAQAEIMSQFNANDPAIRGAIAGTAGDWRMVAVDVDGCDLADGERVVRIDWTAAVADPDGVRRQLLGLARQNRSDPE